MNFYQDKQKKTLILWVVSGILLFILSAGIGALLVLSNSRTVDVTPTETSIENTVHDTTGEQKPKTSFSSSKLGTVDSDLPYCTMNETTLAMDIYWPKEGEGPFPMVVYVHGGGWKAGDKSEGIEKYSDALVSAGFVIASVNYRLSPESKFPAMIEDVKCAVRHLRANADIYNIDPDRIGGMGSSAGGHIINLLGTTDTSAGWDVGPYLDQSSRVSTVVSLYGPSDLQIEFAGNSTHNINTIFDTTDFADMGFASPIEYVTSDDSSFLLIHGEDDSLVPITQSESFYNALQLADVTTTFVPVAGANHGFIAIDKHTPISPSLAEIITKITDWFKQGL